MSSPIAIYKIYFFNIVHDIISFYDQLTLIYRFLLQIIRDLHTDSLPRITVAHLDDKMSPLTLNFRVWSCWNGSGWTAT